MTLPTPAYYSKYFKFICTGIKKNEKKQRSHVILMVTDDHDPNNALKLFNKFSEKHFEEIVVPFNFGYHVPVLENIDSVQFVSWTLLNKYQSIDGLNFKEINI